MGQSSVYFFDRPARIWEETLPLGNGRIGLMPDGGIDRESWLLNSLGQIRRLLFEGRNDEAQKLMYQTFVCSECSVWKLSIIWLFDRQFYLFGQLGFGKELSATLGFG